MGDYRYVECIIRFLVENFVPLFVLSSVIKKSTLYSDDSNPVQAFCMIDAICSLRISDLSEAV